MTGDFRLNVNFILFQLIILYDDAPYYTTNVKRNQ